MHCVDTFNYFIKVRNQLHFNCPPFNCFSTVRVLGLMDVVYHHEYQTASNEQAVADMNMRAHAGRHYDDLFYFGYLNSFTAS